MITIRWKCGHRLRGEKIGNSFGRIMTVQTIRQTVLYLKTDSDYNYCIQERQSQVEYNTIVFLFV